MIIKFAIIPKDMHIKTEEGPDIITIPYSLNMLNLLAESGGQAPLVVGIQY